MSITRNTDCERFEYTGDVQEYTVPINGLYKLEVFGASGGKVHVINQNVKNVGGMGGYSVGYIFLSAGQTLNICVGGEGGAIGNAFDGSKVYADGGYNGGGQSGLIGQPLCTGGGGATHIVLGPVREPSPGDAKLGIKRGALSNYENYKSEVLIVAGGGGGGVATSGYGGNDYYDTGYSYPVNLIGGSGGGLTGGDGSMEYDLRDDPVGYGPGHGGTQTGLGAPSSVNEAGGRFGRSVLTDPSNIDFSAEHVMGWLTPFYAGGGGGGWYGGNTGGQEGAGGGGSGYIGGTPAITYRGVTYEPSTVNGYNNGNGAAVITLMQKSAPSLYLGDKEISAIYFGTRDITDIKVPAP